MAYMAMVRYITAFLSSKIVGRRSNYRRRSRRLDSFGLVIAAFPAADDRRHSRCRRRLPVDRCLWRALAVDVASPHRNSDRRATATWHLDRPPVGLAEMPAGSAISLLGHRRGVEHIPVSVSGKIDAQNGMSSLGAAIAGITGGAVAGVVMVSACVWEFLSRRHGTILPRKVVSVAMMSIRLPTQESVSSP